MLIGDVAAKSGLTADALRYYERVGLLTSPSRNAQGRRVYHENVLDLLAVVTALRGAGFGIRDVKSVLAVKDPAAASEERIERLQKVIDDLLQQLDVRHQELERAKDLLRGFRDELNFALA